MKKTPYHKVKYRALRSISPKAWVVECYDGSEDILPKSQCVDCYDYLLVPTWLAEKKAIQYATKKIWR